MHSQERIVVLATVRAVLRQALHPGDAARGDGAPEGRGLATRPWDGRAFSYTVLGKMLYEVMAQIE